MQLSHKLKLPTNFNKKTVSNSMAEGLINRLEAWKCRNSPE
jgi:hypothetical protein